MIEVIQEYKSLINHIDDYIKLSGYKIEFLQDKLGIGGVAFWRKRKKAKFTLSEMEILSSYIFTDEVEDKLLLEKMNVDRPEFLGIQQSKDFINAL